MFALRWGIRFILRRGIKFKPQYALRRAQCRNTHGARQATGPSSIWHARQCSVLLAFQELQGQILVSSPSSAASFATHGGPGVAAVPEGSWRLQTAVFWKGSVYWVGVLALKMAPAGQTIQFYAPHRWVTDINKTHPYIYTYTYIHIYIYIYIHICIYTQTHTCRYIYIYVYVCIFICVYIYIYIYMCVYVYTYIYIYIYMYTYVI